MLVLYTVSYQVGLGNNRIINSVRHTARYAACNMFLCQFLVNTFEERHNCVGVIVDQMVAKLIDFCARPRARRVVAGRALWPQSRSGGRHGPGGRWYSRGRPIVRLVVIYILDFYYRSIYRHSSMPSERRNGPPSTGRCLFLDTTFTPKESTHDPA